ncbi:class I SAM-dependent methyltransferase [Klenkia taihuensis]|uniref:Methyltransferase domain-containing protein n=1 Tax=Klenkia taihuensis TaxID=1225127 RepID=A0A1I1KLS4_9ACTN|nr:class I SAM-dependent methyltransferase [Klenkia taihuensis]GHE10206.1 methyltransferase [Klenkia taihuensis]SFC61816.1 Methyltransferase domain-containing protein [Klenkia taihuensis]
MTDLEGLRASYDRVADAYVGMQAGDLGPHPWLRAALAAFAEDVQGLGPVLDVGCGPGQVSAHLAGLGVDVSGVDLSPRMVEHARSAYPQLRFGVVSATELRPEPGSLGGVLAWWSLFHLPRASVRSVLAALADALVPGGQLAWGTHVGDGEVQRSDAYGVGGVSWTTYLWQPEEMAAVLTGAGLEPVAELRFPPLWTARPQALLVARRPG